MCAQVLGGVMSLRAHGERVLVKLVFDAERYDSDAAEPVLEHKQANTVDAEV